MSRPKYQIKVIEHTTGKVVHATKPRLDKAKVDKIDDGMQHNLDHDRFYTLIAEVEK
jgi:hypothetical protein